MRVAFVSTILACPWGGADKLWTRAAEAAMRDEAHAVFAAVSREVAEHPRMLRLAEHGARVHHRDGFTQPKGRRHLFVQELKQMVGDRSSLYVDLESFAPDFVFLCQGGTFDFMVEPGLLAWLATKRLPFAVVCQANGDTAVVTNEMRETATRVFSDARAVVFVSTHNHRLAERQIAAEIPNAVVAQNPVEFCPRSLPWPEAASTNLAVVARIEAHSKGLDLLMEALGTGLRDSPGWHVNLYGQGPDERYVRDLADRWGVGARVEFHGFVSDVEGIWARNHLLLLPSRYEGCALAMLEALACGRPVLATDVGGVSDWIRHGQNGFVCPAAATSLLVKTLKDALSSRDQWRAMGCQASVTAKRLDPAPESALLGLLNR